MWADIRGECSDTECSKGVDEEDAVRLEGLDAKNPACLELLVLRGGMYEPEGLEFKYTVMKHWCCYWMTRSSEFGVDTELH